MCKNQAEQLIAKGNSLVHEIISVNSQINNLEQQISSIKSTERSYSTKNKQLSSQTSQQLKNIQSEIGGLKNKANSLKKTLGSICDNLEKILKSVEKNITSLKNAEHQYGSINIKSSSGAQQEINQAISTAQRSETNYKNLAEHIKSSIQSFKQALSSSTSFSTGSSGLGDLVSGVQSKSSVRNYISLSDNYLLKRNYNPESHYSIDGKITLYESMFKKPYKSLYSKNYYQHQDYLDKISLNNQKYLHADPDAIKMEWKTGLKDKYGFPFMKFHDGTNRQITIHYDKNNERITASHVKNSDGSHKFINPADGFLAAEMIKRLKGLNDR